MNKRHVVVWTVAATLATGIVFGEERTAEHIETKVDYAQPVESAETLGPGVVSTATVTHFQSFPDDFCRID